MGESSVLKIISEKWVKPSSPTPPSSRYYKFSAFDLLFEDFATPWALFYPKGSFHGGESSRSELFDLLETSLSRTLTYYYPFAGRFMDDNITVDCNDAGVKVWEVQIQASMSEVLDNHVDYHPWNSAFLQEMSCCDISHVKIQLSYFECGGICIVISYSHKLGDGTTMANFIIDWAMIARGSQEVPTPTPVLSAASIFPPTNDTNSKICQVSSSNLVTQRFVFSSSSIYELKKKVEKETEIKNPTQVEVVTALIFKSAMSAAAKVNSIPFKPSSILQAINFRPLTIPPLPEKMVGNLADIFVITVEEEKEMALSRIVTELRKSKVECVNSYKTHLLGQLPRFWMEDGKKLKHNCFDWYVSSSCFRMPFYEANFGFGKPIFVCTPGGLSERGIILMGTPRGSEIDAFVTLKQDQMSIFEHDEELLAFASLNPTICVAN